MKSAARLLVVEDDADIRRFVCTSLEAEGFSVFEAETATRALIEAASRQPELFIVDLGLPDRDGRELIAELRGWTLAPIIVLSARDREEEKVAALDAGADDYLVKPFGVPELLARVRAQLRRSAVVAGADHAKVVSFGEVTVDLAHREVTRQGELIRLTPIEYRLLAALIKGHGRVLTHRRLLVEVWGPNAVERAHYLRIYMGNLRQKLEVDPAKPRHLLTELGVGYRLIGLN
ncbi:response regulator [Cupriavidus oxalaticus]|uniref:Response regulator n=1 Tax=Cupriavidus oxalaticus TaxID=96344 RepID=A0A375FS86_9BURK|nr:response regulator [Cupriavidus oxalaticus]QRQ85913.1 response regulator [Cupriavidus oxalaticus]QRQ95761.1 response regulator [Cupriavidus oxalaticus]WQD84427.1 response regulator [Cupriavidus oxalaticus]SPC06675.1 response regulator (OmpR family) in two-component regulatory system with KdpD, regulation of potassium translocation [Cupriavidus oxalaticus]SPC12339.1 DNA-binding response regulator in two-component regulatory system with KdpD [Cupriavidus oxalaticus]